VADRLLSTGQAAKIIGVSTSSLSHWVNGGLIEPTLVTPGGQYRFDLDELRAQIRRRLPAGELEAGASKAKRMLSTGEAAKAIGVSPRSLSRWTSEGLIEPSLVTPGGQFRFDLDELKAQMQRRKPPGRDD
jgi:DNA-binding transcriptional MerR regulator